MKNIDKELIDWAINKIKSEYKEDIALLIGQVGACKTPDDEQNMSFDFFVPATERGNNLATTFIIEDMGYDLYPISWERLEGIANFNEPRMIFAVAKGEVIYAKTEEYRKRFNDIKIKIKNNLKNPKFTFNKALEFLNTAMEIYQTMMFEDSLCAVRKAAGGISCYLMNAIAIINGHYLLNGYGNLTLEMRNMKEIPKNYEKIYNDILLANSIEELQNKSHELIKTTRDFFIIHKPDNNKKNINELINYDDLASWYQEARYSFRKIEYYSEHKSIEDCFLLGCYLQIEFDAIKEDFNLKEMDLLGSFNGAHLNEFAAKAKSLENYLLKVLKENNASLKIYHDYNEFIKEN